MWTYFLLFLGGLAIVGVFGRRAVLLVKKMRTPKNEPEKRAEEEEGEEAKVSRANREKAQGLFEKGRGMIKGGREDDAIKMFVQALAADPAHQETQHELAMLYMNKQMFAAASALFAQLAELTKDPVHFSHLGFALFQQNSFEDAKQAYQKAVDLDPSRPQRFVSLAQVYRALNQPVAAIVALNKALEMEDENHDLLFFMADLQAEAGETEKAKLLLRRILSANPEDADAKALLKNLENTK